jgi:hypothetical protein
MISLFNMPHLSKISTNNIQNNIHSSYTLNKAQNEICFQNNFKPIKNQSTLQMTIQNS